MNLYQWLEKKLGPEMAIPVSALAFVFSIFVTIGVLAVIAVGLWKLCRVIVEM